MRVFDLSRCGPADENGCRGCRDFSPRSVPVATDRRFDWPRSLCFIRGENHLLEARYCRPNVTTIWEPV